MAQMSYEASTACRDIQFQRFPNQARDDPTPTRRKPGDGVTWIRKGTLGSIGGAGVPPTPTIQALLIARSRLARPLWTSWSKMVVA